MSCMLGRMCYIINQVLAEVSQFKIWIISMVLESLNGCLDGKTRNGQNGLSYSAQPRALFYSLRSIKYWRECKRKNVVYT